MYTYVIAINNNYNSCSFKCIYKEIISIYKIIKFTHDKYILQINTSTKDTIYIGYEIDFFTILISFSRSILFTIIILLKLISVIFYKNYYF